MRSRTNVHYLVFHLTLADTVTSYVTLPMETVWKYTIQWHASNSLCKVLSLSENQREFREFHQNQSLNALNPWVSMGFKRYVI